MWGSPRVLPGRAPAKRALQMKADGADPAPRRSIARDGDRTYRELSLSPSRSRLPAVVATSESAGGAGRARHLRTLCLRVDQGVMTSRRVSDWVPQVRRAK